MNEPKRHHYVPQFYLKNFADSAERIWVYDRKTKEYRHQNVKDTALKNHYYRVEKGGKYHTEVEKLLSEIEGLAAAAILKLENHEPLTENDRLHICLFVALQKTRVPDFEKGTNEMEEKMYRRITKELFSSVEVAEEAINKYKDEVAAIGGGSVDAQQLFEFVQEDRYRVEIPRQNTIRAMLKIADHLMPYFMQMDWILLRAADGAAFITTDNPFTIFPPAWYNPNSFLGVGVLTRGAKKSVPLSPKSALFFLDRGSRYGENLVPRDKMRFFNESYAHNSDRFIFARDEALLRSVVERSKIDEVPFERERVVMS